MPVVEAASSTRANRASTSPRDRPPLTLRLLFGLTSIAATLTAVALMLSDRAPGTVEAVFGDRARRLWVRVDASPRVGLPSTSELPSTDVVIHVAVWAVIAGLVGLTLWTWRGLVVSAGVLTVASGLLELAQGRYATTRSVEISDAVANLMGIGVGLAAAGACFLIWSAVARSARVLVRQLPRRRAGRASWE